MFPDHACMFVYIALHSFSKSLSPLLPTYLHLINSLSFSCAVVMSLMKELVRVLKRRTLSFLIDLVKNSNVIIVINLMS